MPTLTKLNRALEAGSEFIRSGIGAFVVAVLPLIAFPCLATAASSMAVNGITFHFDSDYSTGTFVDGMPWVVEKSPGGGVRVTRMTPDYQNGRHGYEVNPKTKGLAQGQMGCTADACHLVQIDSRLGNGSGYHWVSPDTNIPLPRTFPAGSSVLKVISYTGPGDCYNKRDGAPARTCIDHAAVLTVLSSAPPANSFRPPYSGTQKPIFSASAIDIDRLPRLADVSNQISIAAVEAIFGAGDVFVNHVHGWVAERAYPRFSTILVGGAGPETYGCQVGIQHNSAMLRSMQSGTAAAKRNLVYGLVQRGIDAYFVTKNGKTWGNVGGCVTPGWKPLILYSGYLLQFQPGGSQLLTGYTGGSDEDKNTYAGAGGEALWGVSDKTCVNQPAKCENGYEMMPSCDGLRDAGPCKFGTACTTCGRQPTLTEQRTSGKFSMTFYQQMSHARVGSATVARILGIENDWNYAPFFQYIDRIATPPWNYYCSTHCANYLVSMHKAYGCNSAECAGRRGGSSSPTRLPAPVVQ